MPPSPALRCAPFQSTSSMWRTTYPGMGCFWYRRFQSTSSMWRTTNSEITQGVLVAISIHVLHVEDDRRRTERARRIPHFNPRPPCGGRRIKRDPARNWRIFQSTSSMWRTTKKSGGRTTQIQFQSTSSMWRTTELDQFDGEEQIHFNPRPPCGGRRDRLIVNTTTGQFQSTSSMWRTTAAVISTSAATSISIHVLHVEDDAAHASI